MLGRVYDSIRADGGDTISCTKTEIKVSLPSITRLHVFRHRFTKVINFNEICKE